MSTPFEDKMKKYRTGGNTAPQGLDTLRGVSTGDFNQEAPTQKGGNFVKRMQSHQISKAELPDARRNCTPNS
ncbi:MAG: hypothetical protein ACRBCT_02860 [Alphaproteobacteria bacterium]